MRYNSPIYRIDPARLARVAAWQWLSRWWWCFVLPLAAFAFMAFADVRYVFVCLIVVFIVWPMALTMAWFWLCGSPNVIDNIRPATVEVTDDGIVFAYNPVEGDDDDNKVPTVVHRYAWNDFNRSETTNRLVVLYLRDTAHAFLAVPVDKLSDDSLQMITDKTNKPIDD